MAKMFNLRPTRIHRLSKQECLTWRSCTEHWTGKVTRSVVAFGQWYSVWCMGGCGVWMCGCVACG